MSDDTPNLAGLMSRRRKKAQQSDDGGDGTSSGVETKSSQSVAIVKMAKDISELDLPDTVELIADKADNFLKFSLVIKPKDGLWAGGRFEFKFEIPDDYPWASPVCTCVDKIWHPNIDMQGKPCVNVLQKNWKPTFTIETIVFGLLFLFSDPNPHDPLNLEAAEEMRTNLTMFKRNVLGALRGGYVHGQHFPHNAGDASLFGSYH